MPELRIGCSGFSYVHWKGDFYPAGLPQKKWFAHYFSVFNTVELNVSFYRLPLASTFEKWYSESPADFCFSVKGSRFITHIKRLLDPEEPLELFCERAAILREKLRVVLWQFPPKFGLALERLEHFIALLKHCPGRQTFEFRNESWITDEVVTLFKKHNIALCMADWPPFVQDLPITADFVYIRRHGAGGDNTGNFSDEFLRGDAERIRRYLHADKNVYIYFNNDAYGNAPRNARTLSRMLQ